MSTCYYIRPRSDDNPKSWRGPFDVEQLREQAKARKFTKLHEFSEDRLNWLPALKIWGQLFNTAPKSLEAVVARPIADLVETTNTESVMFGGASTDPDLITNRIDAVEPEESAWHYLQGTVQQPPVSWSQLKTLAAQGALQPADLVWNPQVGDEWIPAQSIAELWPGDRVVGSPIAGEAVSTKSSSLAVFSLVAGILGIVFLPLFGNIVAIILGHLGLVEIQRSAGKFRGREMAIMGLILGYLGLALWFMTAVLVVWWLLPRA